MTRNPLLDLERLGQSIWLDFIRREAIKSGELAGLINDDGISGVTSNPLIFEKAIAGSRDYDEAIRALALEGKTAEEIYRSLTVEDIKNAADLFRPVYDRTNAGDGYVSIEVSPALAHDAERTIAEARQLWQAVGRPNIYIKVPGTKAGLEAIRQLISEGVNVNVTLLFGLPRYREVADAYLSGLEARAEKGGSLENISSVASFFMSRIDSIVDKVFEEKIQKQSTNTADAVRSRGQVAISSAKLAYEIFGELFQNDRFGKLEAAGAKKQRLLWASTSTKNPAYSDVKYAEALIGPETVNTLPLETLNAYRDHGDPAARLSGDLDNAHRVLERLPALGIDIDEVTQHLEDNGVTKFENAYTVLLNALQDKREAALHEPVDRQTFSLGSLGKVVSDRITQAGNEHLAARLWQKDSSLWKSDEADRKIIKNSLGWLHAAEKLEEVLDDLLDFTAEVEEAGFKHVVHMGMGGSSLAPLVMAESFGKFEEGLPFTVLDTTDPATILKIEQEVPLSETLFIVASKSGTTVELNAFCDYFYEKLKALKGSYAGGNFIAITDPGSKLVNIARERKFRRTFLNFSDIGGRYSALSYFGLVPAVLLGIDVPEFLTRALRMVHACQSCVPAEKNPGLALGAAMGELAIKGRDKLTLMVPKKMESFGLWLEQLVAESTGKEVKGILPVSGEPLLDSDDYGQDRFFVCVKMNGDDDGATVALVRKLIDAGHPVVTIDLADVYDLAQEFFRWEFAAAVAGAIIGINAFDQPNVQESKDNTVRLLDEIRANGSLRDESPSMQDDDLKVYGTVSGNTLAEALKSFLAQSKPCDYVSIMAYLQVSSEVEERIFPMRNEIAKKLRLAATFGYGPRFLHSTGQYHKGGPNTGLFIQLTAEDTADAPIPGQTYGFSVLKRAQALGDLETLRNHERRVLHIDLGKDVVAGLDKLKEAFTVAFG